MDSHMATGTCTLNEGISRGLVTGMSSQMSGEVWHEIEGFSTLFTFRGFLASMGPLMFLVGHLGTKGSFAKFTSVDSGLLAERLADYWWGTGASPRISAFLGICSWRSCWLFSKIWTSLQVISVKACFLSEDLGITHCSRLIGFSLLTWHKSNGSAGEHPPLCPTCQKLSISKCSIPASKDDFSTGWLCFGVRSLVSGPLSQSKRNVDGSLL